jgi:predicted transposase/invertase (TIGR01784 family)
MANQHDTRYKKLFKNPLLVEELLTSFVDEDFIKDLDFSTLKKLDKSFVSDAFRNKESDMIYQVKFKDDLIYIFLLLEFQSSVDKKMSLRMLRYICEFYEELEFKGEKLPAMFPVLLYNGDSKWTAETNIKNIIEDTLPKEFIPNFSYYKIAENEFSPETLYKIKNTVSAIFLIENIGNIENLRNEIRNIISLIKDEKPEIIQLFRRWTNNLLGFYDKTINREITTIEEETEMFATVLEKHDKKLFLKGREEGIEEGIEKGIEKGMRNVAIKLLKKGESPENISDITGLSVKEIELIKREM